MARDVVCLGLTPAVQRTLVFDHVEMGEVNRARECRQTSAGKAVNAALALAALGTPVSVTGFNGGPTGRFLASYVRARGVRPRFTPMAEPTRTCTTVIAAASGVITELVEEGPDPGSAARATFVLRNERLSARARLLAICGTLPPGTPDDFYVPFVRAATAARVPVVVDSHRAGLLRILPFRPLLVKLSVRELEKTFGTPCGDEAALLRTAERLRAGGAQWALVTCGGRPAYLLGDASAVRLEPPAVAVVNAIGSGDCATAGFIHAWLAGAGSVEEAAAFGLGCGTANALTLLPAHFDPDEARRLAARVRRQAVSCQTAGP